MVETLAYKSEDYEQFHPLSPELGDTELIAARKQYAFELRQAVDLVRGVEGRFRSKSEFGAFLNKASLRAMQGRVGGLDARWVGDIKSLFMGLTKGSETSWSGVVAEFSAARLLQEAGHIVRFPGNLPENVSKPRGYNELTQAEQDRLQGIDWWLEMKDTPQTVTVKSMPFTPEGVVNNQLVYPLHGNYEKILSGIINDRYVEKTENSQLPSERLGDALQAAAKTRNSAVQYGAGALLMLIPSLGNDSNFNRHTGEPSSEVIQICADRLQEVQADGISTLNSSETIDHAI